MQASLELRAGTHRRPDRTQPRQRWYFHCSPGAGFTWTFRTSRRAGRLRGGFRRDATARVVVPQVDVGLVRRQTETRGGASCWTTWGRRLPATVKREVPAASAIEAAECRVSGPSAVESFQVDPSGRSGNACTLDPRIPVRSELLPPGTEIGQRRRTCLCALRSRHRAVGATVVSQSAPAVPAPVHHLSMKDISNACDPG